MIDRAAELALIEAHIAERGVTRCPSSGDPDLLLLSLRRMLAERVAHRKPERRLRLGGRRRAKKSEG